MNQSGKPWNSHGWLVRHRCVIHLSSFDFEWGAQHDMLSTLLEYSVLSSNANQQIEMRAIIKGGSDDYGLSLSSLFSCFNEESLFALTKHHRITDSLLVPAHALLVVNILFLFCGKNVTKFNWPWSPKMTVAYVHCAEHDNIMHSWVAMLLWRLRFLLQPTLLTRTAIELNTCSLH